MNLISRADAKTAGQRHYFTGKPCLHGHITKRFVSTRKCGGCCHMADHRRYNRDVERERARSRAYQRTKLPAPTRPCPALCELCGQPPKNRALHLDHDHESGIFRGWLCCVCNTGIGKLGDSVAGLLRAVAYLRAAEN